MKKQNLRLDFLSNSLAKGYIKHHQKHVLAIASDYVKTQAVLPANCVFRRITAWMPFFKLMKGAVQRLNRSSVFFNRIVAKANTETK